MAFVYEVEAEGEIKFDHKEVTEAKWFGFDDLLVEKDFAFDHFEIVHSYLAKRSGN